MFPHGVHFTHKAEGSACAGEQSCLRSSVVGRGQQRTVSSCDRHGDGPLLLVGPFFCLRGLMRSAQAKPVGKVELFAQLRRLQVFAQVREALL